MKLEYHSPSIDNGEKIEFNKFELKTQANVRDMWNTYFRFETKIPLELEGTLQRSIEDMQASIGILKCNIVVYVEIIIVIFISCYECQFHFEKLIFY